MSCRRDSCCLLVLCRCLEDIGKVDFARSFDLEISGNMAQILWCTMSLASPATYLKKGKMPRFQPLEKTNAMRVRDITLALFTSFHVSITIPPKYATYFRSQVFSPLKPTPKIRRSTQHLLLLNMSHPSSKSHVLLPIKSSLTRIIFLFFLQPPLLLSIPPNIQ